MTPTRARGFVLGTCAWLCAAAAGAGQEVIDADRAIALLKEGNARFVAEHKAKKDVSARRREELSGGQAPFAIVLCCADSRTAPELVFDEGLGQLFVVRVAGNVTDPALLGSIEYAVAHLKSPLIVVLGHTQCGAVKTALEAHEEPTENIRDLLKRVHTGPDLPADPSAAVDAGVRANVVYQTGRLVKDSRLVREFVEAKRVRVVGAVFSLKSGEVGWLDADPGTKRK